MAEIVQGILGGVKGKVGTVIGVTWRGKSIIRALPRKTKKKASEKQLDQRQKFKVVAHFLSPLFALTSKYFGQYQGVKSRTNLAMSYHLVETIQKVGGAFVIDYAKVVITKGILNGIIAPKAERKDNTIALTWSDGVTNPLSKPDDAVTVIVYNPNEQLFYITNMQSKRSDKKQSVVLAESWTNKNNEVWVVVTNAEQCSTSMYIGKF
ncbi:MAG: DUF6266 family protein [Flavobacteriaceae bacterium]|jgi:hypothetical protein|nr:DUF6266 family protein [Flavobacteriaceae bacterium]